MVSGPSGVVSLFAFGVMCLFTIWFGNFMLRTLDILYKPSIKHWIRDKANEDIFIENHQNLEEVLLFFPKVFFKASF